MTVANGSFGQSAQGAFIESPQGARGYGVDANGHFTFGLVYHTRTYQESFSDTKAGTRQFVIDGVVSEWDPTFSSLTITYTPFYDFTFNDGWSARVTDYDNGPTAPGPTILVESAAPVFAQTVLDELELQPVVFLDAALNARWGIASYPGPGILPNTQDDARLVAIGETGTEPEIDRFGVVDARSLTASGYLPAGALYQERFKIVYSPAHPTAEGPGRPANYYWTGIDQVFPYGNFNVLLDSNMNQFGQVDRYRIPTYITNPDGPDEDLSTVRDTISSWLQARLAEYADDYWQPVEAP